MLLTGSSQIDAERAFTHAARVRRRAALVRRLRRRCLECARLPVHDARTARRRVVTPGRGIREIPLDAIDGTVEPARAEQFDSDFRPAPLARRRWESVWLAEHRGVALPPITVVEVADGYAVLDGHHRVSVAKARGAQTIDAVVDGA